MNKSFTEIEVTDSTNNYAMQLVQKGSAKHGAGIFAHNQTSGKGQHGKEWMGEAGQNIALSVILQTKTLAISSQPVFNMAVALTAYDFFKTYAGEESSVKWPNDIYWRDRKAGGILIESRLSHTWLWAVVGMGININQTQFAEGLLRPVSLKQITGKTHDIHALAKELCQCLEYRYQGIHDPQQLLADYRQAMYKLGQTVKLKEGDIVFETTVMGVTPLGQLVTSHRPEHHYEVGEIEWII